MWDSKDGWKKHKKSNIPSPVFFGLKMLVPHSYIGEVSTAYNKEQHILDYKANQQLK